jgi:hypothetical protein
MDTTQAPNSGKQDYTKLEKRHIKVNEINYRNNLESDYTEKIVTLEKSFDYASNNDHYWGKPEQSVLYGTPLYEAASESQKLALNHLYWVGHYDHIAAAEASTIHYNQVTAGVFSQIGDYQGICSNLKPEAEQEKSHIHAFHHIFSKTKIALLGKRTMGLKLNKNSSSHQNWSQKLISEFQQSFSQNFQYDALRFLSKTLLKSQTYHYSSYLQDLDEKREPLTALSKGALGMAIPSPLLQFFAFCWGSSPFLACQYYTYRYAANTVLKNYEHNYFQHFKELEKEEKFTPIPTAVSYYHCLDESFHMTTSQLIARDMYKEFPQPTVSEKVIANLVFYLMQRGFLGGLPGGLIGSFVHESSMMPLYYRILRSPLFDMPAQEALHWMEKCLCHEHQGFHVQTQYHQRALKTMSGLASSLDYLWPINREMRIMAAGGSISKAIENNIKAFNEFREIAVV